jgi:hypothetical protein
MSRFRGQVTPKGAKSLSYCIEQREPGRLRKYTIRPYGRVTNQARVTAQKVFAAKLDGRDLAAEKDPGEGWLQTALMICLGRLLRSTFANRSAPEISRMLRREVGSAGGNQTFTRSPNDVIDVVSASSNAERRSRQTRR